MPPRMDFTKPESSDAGRARWSNYDTFREGVVNRLRPLRVCNFFWGRNVCDTIDSAGSKV